MDTQGIIRWASERTRRIKKEKEEKCENQKYQLEDRIIDLSSSIEIVLYLVETLNHYCEMVNHLAEALANERKQRDVVDEEIDNLRQQLFNLQEENNIIQQSIAQLAKYNNNLESQLRARLINEMNPPAKNSVPLIQFD